MLRARGVAICATLVAASSLAAAQGTGGGAPVVAARSAPPPRSGVTLRARSLHGFARELRAGIRYDDYWYQLTPEILALHLEPRWDASASYAPTGVLHSDLPDEIAHRATALAGAELSRRTRGTLSAEGSYSTVSNFLVTRPAYLTPIAAVPRREINLLATAAAQGLTWEATPVVRLEQRLGVQHLVLYDPTGGDTASYLATASIGVERGWKVDALGLEARGGYAYVDPPAHALDQRLVTATLAPRWRHDYSRALSSVVTGGATLMFSPDTGTDPAVVPTGRGTLLHDFETAHVEIAYGYGVEPNVMTGQLLRAHQATVTGVMPLAERDRVLAGATIGYLRGAFVDLREGAPARPDFDAVRADLELAWSPKPPLQVIARYQLLTQSSDTTPTPGPRVDDTVVRHAIIGGVQVTALAPGLGGPPVGPPRPAQRVDRRDGAP